MSKADKARKLAEPPEWECCIDGCQCDPDALKTGQPVDVTTGYEPFTKQRGGDTQFRADGQRVVVYVSGPMEGYPGHNFEAFNATALLLRELGYEVVNPAENFDGRTDVARRVALRRDVELMSADCNAIVFLDGWQNSAGARLEYNIARELEFEFIDLEGDTVSTVEPVELEASRIVRNGERQRNYGHPNQDFSRTAGMWSAFLGVDISMQDVALMMGMLKMSRLKSTPGHRDSNVDLIGYAICYERLDEES